MTKENKSEKEVLVEMWQGLGKTLEQAGEIIEDATKNLNPIEQAEGYRHTLRLLAHSMTAFLENSDPLRPEFRRMVTPYIKFFGDNPDVFYDCAPLKGDQTYRIRGNRGTATYLGFIFYRTSYNDRIAANFSHKDIAIEPDGSFEITLSAEKQDGNWFKLDPKGSELVIRQYFLDKENEVPATYDIECIGSHPTAPPPLTSKRMAKSISIFNRFIPSALQRSVDFMDEQFANPNNFIQFDPLNPVIMALLPTSDNQYTGAAYDLQEDEALVIIVKPPETIYWSIQLWNRWFESYDFRHHSVIINKRQAQLEPDGTFKTVIAHKDPGVPNWLDTAGHIQGMIGFRWMLCDETPEPQCQIVKLCDL